MAYYLKKLLFFYELSFFGPQSSREAEAKHLKEISEEVNDDIKNLDKDEYNKKYKSIDEVFSDLNKKLKKKK